MASPLTGTRGHMVLLTFATLASIVGLVVRSEARRPVRPLI